MKTQELNIEELKQVNGGSILGGNGLDLGNVLQGVIGITNSSSGMDGNQSYSSTDSHMAQFGLGDVLNAVNF